MMHGLQKISNSCVVSLSISTVLRGCSIDDTYIDIFVMALWHSWLGYLLRTGGREILPGSKIVRIEE